MIKTVIFDWAGTTVDFGCMAPVHAFRNAFLEKGIQLTDKEIREPMGKLKWIISNSFFPSLLSKNNG